MIERRARDGTVALVTRGDALDHADPVTASTAIPGIVVARNGRPIRVTPTARTSWLTNPASRVVRSRAVLRLILKLHALARRLVPATV